MSKTKSSEALLERFRQDPDDDALRVEAARALDGKGEASAAFDLLVERFVNLTAHEASPLPCLCKRCIEPSRSQASLDGEPFSRCFAVASGRVLFFWAPKDIARQPFLARAVSQRMITRLAKRRRP